MQLDFFVRPDHVLQEKHLLQSLQVEYSPTLSFYGLSA